MALNFVKMRQRFGWATGLVVIIALITTLSCMDLAKETVALVSRGESCIVASNVQSDATTPTLLELRRYPDCDTLNSGDGILRIVGSDRDARFTLSADSLLVVSTFWLEDSRVKRVFILNPEILPEKEVTLYRAELPLLEIASVKAELLETALFRLQEYEKVWLLRVTWSADWYFGNGNVFEGEGRTYNDIYLVNVDRCAVELTSEGLVEVKTIWNGNQAKTHLVLEPPDTIGGFFTVSISR